MCCYPNAFTSPTEPLQPTSPQHTTTLSTHSHPTNALPQDHHNTTFPWDTAAILCILQHLFATLSSPSTTHHWDTQAQHHLLNNFQHYIHHPEQCLSANGMLFKSQGPHNLLLSINKYFGWIQDFLLTHHHRPCTWDHILLKACICFQRLYNLTRVMRN
uniref:Interferon alpha n=1 Tax=Strix occidentalis caurina TaxID=311401 RepID=A0A8D0FK41_STROC